MSDIVDIAPCPLAGLLYSPRCSRPLYPWRSPRRIQRCSLPVYPCHTIARMSEVLFPAVRRRSWRRRLQAKPEQSPEARYIMLVYLFSSFPPFFYFTFCPVLIQITN